MVKVHILKTTEEDLCLIKRNRKLRPLSNNSGQTYKLEVSLINYVDLSLKDPVYL